MPRRKNYLHPCFVLDLVTKTRRKNQKHFSRVLRMDIFNNVIENRQGRQNSRHVSNKKFVINIDQKEKTKDFLKKKVSRNENFWENFVTVLLS